MVILHITDILNAKGNGVAVAVNNYTIYESKNNDVGLYNLDDTIENCNCKSFSYDNYKKILNLPKPFCQPDLVIFNEVYKPKYMKLYKECLKNNIDYIIIPHGCLVKESQNKHKLKKMICNFLLFNRFIKKANAIQFLNKEEKVNSNFKYKRFIIAGNGVAAPSFKNEFKDELKNIVFIGRYNIKIKGLDLLVKVCSENYRWFVENNVRIELYGRDTLNNLIKLKEIVEELNISKIFIINDAVYDSKKYDVLKNAYAFIQLSRHEGQPTGILEALSIGVPCIVTYGTNLGDYVKNNECGIACNFDSKEVFNAICKIVNNENLRRMYSNNSYNKSNVDFCWDTIIENTLNEYKKVKKGE